MTRRQREAWCGAWWVMWWCHAACVLAILHAHTQAELDQGASIAALRRFNDNLRNIPAERWGEEGCGAALPGVRGGGG